MDSTEIQGSIERITFFNEENNYGVIKILAEGNYPEAQSPFDGTVTVTGIMPDLVVGESAKFAGKWVNDARYGLQFKADNVMPIMPGSEEGIIKYLSSGIVRGIGPKTAEKIVDHFGKDTLNILDNKPQAIHDVPGLKPILADNLIQVWSTNRIKRQVMIYLQGYGISSRLALRIFDEYGNETIKTIQEDPYRLADDMFGIAFKKADAIAQGVGIAKDSRERIRAGLLYALQHLSQEGHTFAPTDYLIETTTELLDIGDTSRISAVLKAQIVAKRLMRQMITQRDGTALEAIYLPVFYYSETGSATRLQNIANAPSKILEDMRNVNWERYLRELAKENDVSLSSQQQGAVRGALMNKVSVLTGGPGTGKTTTLRMVIQALEQEGYSFKLASPTGRAAKRLAEATGYSASTIHRLLGFSPHDGFLYDEDEPLKTDVVIIDESSMIDIVLFYNLLKALKTSTHLLLVGDVDQLPSVGAGNVLHDVIDSGIAHVTRLDEIFRQSEGSQIVTNAHKINQGLQPIADNSGKDFFFFKETDPEKASELVVDIVKNRIPEKFKVDPITDIQVIAPMYRGPIGVNALNKALQSRLNGGSHQAEKKIGNVLFRRGDKVMQTKNNYDKDVFNGDIGKIHAIDFEENQFVVVIDERFIYYDFSEADELIHAYCISTHRSQGSEYPVVVMPLLKQHYMMLQRNLLYTAVTRARDVVVLVGDRQAMYMAVQNNKVTERYSGLADYLRSGVQESPRLL